MDYYIGIDIGTSKVKSVLFDADFNELQIASANTVTYSPLPGYAEQNMSHVWDGVLSTLKTLATSLRLHHGHVRAIGLAGQGEGVWLSDRHGQPVRQAILWSDTRTAEQVHQLKQRPNLEATLFPETGSPLLPCNSAQQLRWLTQHQPDALSDADYFFFAKDWVRFRLTGQANLELTDAGTSLLDLHSETLSKTVLDKLDLHAIRPLFPPLLYPDDIAGTLSDTVAALTGLPVGIPVCAGALDVSAAALGIGAIHDGDIFTILGTTCCTGIVCRGLTQVSLQTRFVAHAWPGHYLNLFAMQSGTPNIDWALSTLAGDADFQTIGARISHVPPGSGGVFYQPYLNGERAPFYSTSARAGFFGIGQSTTNTDLLRAVFEGLAYAITDSLSGYPAHGDLYIAGGGAASAIWLQIIADCTGRRVIASSVKELSACGAARLAALSVGESANMMPSSHPQTLTFFPDADAHRRYQILFPVFRQLRDQLQPLWQARAHALNVLDHHNAAHSHTAYTSQENIAS
ncbi:carbohydrate kinase [Pectobacterium betavasculorum]|uniref:Carbohydrate kinase n=1 Tax=Pectobacterium betavasculorum TaxID=55207 RepID=A0A093RNT9_9GAMM|nr:FGGY-family carbohydrate kinase [Pectobacterium betavasculorum]KFX04817.1 carbohydrate kinase [Pectobacterium betavasculorum]